jgi:ankyrin repeat protein
MTSIDRLRHEICLAVASLEAKADEEDVERKLKPLLDQAASLLRLGTPESLEKSSRLSPLLVASDKGHVASLLLLSRYDATIVGGPLDPCEEKDGGGNAPIHHAAMAGCSEAWEIFADMLLANKNQTIHSKEDDASMIYPTLASVVNAHGDTPLQMAVAAGHLEFLQKWYTLASTTATIHNEVEKEQTTTITQTILQTTNHSGDTCASLACCHGHRHIVDFLLYTSHVSISHDEITKCQETVQRMDQALLKTVTDSTALESFHERQARVHDGLVKLEATVSKQSDDAAIELLLLEGADDNDNKTWTSSASHKITCSSKKSKKKKKGDNKGNIQKARISNAIISQHQATAASASASDKEPIHVTRLNDGRVAVSVFQEKEDSDITGDINDESRLLAPSTLLPSAEAMLRQRFRRRSEGGGDDDNTRNSCHHEHDDIDAVMDALCLDVPMLLYTPHGMALNLSPSQLDAVQQILETQIRSVQQARNLQQCRMHQPIVLATTTTTTTMTTTAIELMKHETAPATNEMIQEIFECPR